MKLIARLTAGLLCVLPLLSFAQHRHMDHDQETMAAKQTERMTESLGLDADQAEKVKEINLQAAMKLKEARMAAKQDREKAWEAKKAIKEEKEAALKNVLSEEQFVKWENDRREKMKNARKGRKGKKNKE